MPPTKETTVHDMKTHFSQYAAELLDGTYGEIIVKNRTKPMLRILPYEPPAHGGLRLDLAKELDLPPIDYDLFDALDADVLEMFKDYV